MKEGRKEGRKTQQSVPATVLADLVRDFLATQQVRDEARQEAMVKKDEAIREELRQFFTAMRPRQEQPLSHQRAFSSLLGEGSPRFDLPPATPFQPPGDLQQRELAPSRPVQSSGLLRNQPFHQPAGPAHPPLLSRPVRPKDPKLPLYQQGEDTENYLLRFERLARTW